MKVKVKLDVASIKKWVLAHGEKLAFGTMVLVFLLFTYSALTREVLDASKQPDQLQVKADDVSRHVAESPWDEKREGVQVVDYQKRVARQPVDVSAFAMRHPFNAPLADPKSERDVPKLLNAEELQAAGGFGAFAYRGQAAAGDRKGNAKPPERNPGQNPRQMGHGYKPSATAQLKGQAWAVITGLIPIDKQQQEYTRAFEHCMGADQERDTPHYDFAPKVQRAEINEAKPDALDWKDLPWSQIREHEKAWESAVSEIVAPPYVDPNLTGRLGPLMEVDWGEAVAHPKVPLASAGDDRPLPPVAQDVEAENVPDAAPPGESPEGFHSLRRTPSPAAATPAATPPGKAPAVLAKYRLLRIFDYSVEPNKKYRYRLKLVAANPNCQVSPQFLKNPESAQSPALQADDWTLPTEVVAIPSGYGVLAGGVESIRGGEPTAKLMLTAIDKREGIAAATEIKVQRGTVANAMEKSVKVVDPRNGQAKDLSDVDFKTEIVVLDIYGGKMLSKKQNIIAPVEVLLLDAQGNLAVRNELDDQGQYEHRKAPAESDARPADRAAATIPGEEAKGSKPPKKPRPAR